MKRPQRILLTLALTLVLALGITTPVLADGPVYGDTVPAGTVIDRDIILVGREVSIAGTVNGNVIVLGNQVELSGTIDGSLVVAGQNVLLDGTVTGAVYAGALTVGLGPDAVLGRDLNTVTVSLVTASGSAVGRDLNAIGLDSGLNGHVERDLHTVIGPIQLYNGLMRLLGFDELTLQLHFESPQPQPTPQGWVPLRHLRLKLLEPLPAFDWSKWGLALLQDWSVLFVFALLAYWLLRRPLRRSGEPLLSHPWRTLGLGLIVLIVSLNLFVVGFLLIVLFFAVGLGLNLMGLWPVTLALWAVAYAALIVGLLGLAFFIAYGTKIIVVALVASWLFSLMTRRKAVWLDLLALLAGTIIYCLLRTIPYAGWVIDILITAAGMGGAWIAYRERGRRLPAAAPAKVVPAARSARPVAPVKPAKAAARPARAAKAAPKKPARQK